MKKSFLFLSLFLSINTFASITQEMVVDSAIKHYPLIIQAKQNIEATGKDVKAAKGAFDGKLVSENLILPKGYYIRRRWDARFEKPIRVANGTLYAGYSYGARGVFPTDLSLTSTNNGGEPYVGVTFSTLRNFSIDSNRAGLKTSRIGFDQSKLDYQFSELQVKRESIVTYWGWISTLRNYKVYLDLLKMAEERDTVLNKRARAGDISQIVVTENNQYVARRRAEKASAELSSKQAALDLSLFFRNEDGTPRSVEGALGPEEAESLIEKSMSEFITKAEKEILSQDKSARAENRPDIMSLGKEIEKINVELALNENNFLPKLDINAEYDRYIGRDDPTNAPHVWQFLVNLEIPLEYNLLKGQKSANIARKRVVTSQYNFLKENIKTEISKNYEGIRFAKERMTNAKDEMGYAHKLLSAETYKFEKGGSNLFLINIREENLAEAKSNYISAQFEFIRAYTEYKASTVNL